MDQLALFTAAKPKRTARTARSTLTRGRDRYPSLDEGFAALVADRPDVWTVFHRRALEMLSTGTKRVSAKHVWESTRAELRNVRMDNSFTSAAARHLIALDARFTGVIETRTRRRA